ncbi:MAG: type secretion system protein [Gemmatimonadetes bacterium]|nr:type secretion system protein [Gemmatimonadota bacterium]
MTASPFPAHADFTHIDPRAVALLAERWARRYQVVPIGIDRGTIILATANPLDLDAERAVAFATGQKVRWELAIPEDIVVHLDRVYNDTPSRPDPVSPPVEVQHLAFNTEGSAEPTADSGASVVRLVDQLLAEAIHAGASDLHLEPEEQGIAVRHRVDGVLRHVRVLPRSVAPSLVSRVKILSALDIADRMRPQDGRARVAVFGTVVDLRVSTLPVSHGEKVVIRVLDGSAGLRTLESIGFAAEDLVRIRTLLEQREGLVLVTGPTGSGKTTTLYAALREIQARGVNVVTVEDPIEYRLAGIVQVQVHERAGLTFSAALRSIMRQDPDVILVGEIRDRETAEIAIQASLTGHLVLSTLHTNDAASAVTRLIDIGIASYQIATAIKGVVAQRLVRRMCTHCNAVGCETCEGAGYRGRRAIAEILTTSPEFERRVAAGAPTESLVETAKSNGFKTLWESGLALVQRGETTIEELRRVAAAPTRFVSEPARPIMSEPSPFRIYWIATPEFDRTNPGWDQFRDAQAAAARLHGQVLIEPLMWPEPNGDVILPACNAIVASTDWAAVLRAKVDARKDRPSLVVALAANRLLHEDVATLANHADLLLPFATPGALVLATILALLRWRGP